MLVHTMSSRWQGWQWPIQGNDIRRLRRTANRAWGDSGTLATH